MNRWNPVGRSPGLRGPGLRSLAKLTLPLACLLPISVAARQEISIYGGGDMQTGDPLDSNDCGAGGGTGDRNQLDQPCPGIASVTLPGPVIDGRRVLLLTVNQGGLLTFRLVIIDERASAPKTSDAR